MRNLASLAPWRFILFFAQYSSSRRHFTLATPTRLRYTVSHMRRPVFVGALIVPRGVGRNQHAVTFQRCEEKEMGAVAEQFLELDKDAVKRDKKGRALAAMGHVARTDE